MGPLSVRSDPHVPSVKAQNDDGGTGKETGGQSGLHDDGLCWHAGVTKFDGESQVKDLNLVPTCLHLDHPPSPAAPPQKNKNYKIYDAGPILFHLHSLVPLVWVREQCARQSLRLDVGIFLIRAPIQWASVGSSWPELMHEGKSHGYAFLIHTWTNKFAVAAGSWFGSHNSKEGN